MTHPRLHSLGVLGIMPARQRPEPFAPIADQCGVRLLLQCVCVQLIVFPSIGSKDYV
jgi:hypothetical protein